MRRGLISVVLLALAAQVACDGLRTATPPPQPVAFSHRLHAGVNRIGCLTCHVYAQHAPVAGIPAMERCHGCHRFVSKDKPAIQLVNQTFEQGKVLEWNQLYRVPDHVYFTHERHIASGLRCQTCHGEVQEMDVLVPVRQLLMGWCVDCHRTKGAPTDCLTCHK